jgi:hypothetical protein
MMLEAFAQRLTGESDPEKCAAIEGQKENAAAHGLQRWRQGYNQRETARDWGHCICAGSPSLKITKVRSTPRRVPPCRLRDAR